jgi:hypothetical protein
MSIFMWFLLPALEGRVLKRKIGSDGRGAPRRSFAFKT